MTSMPCPPTAILRESGLQATRRGLVMTGNGLPIRVRDAVSITKAFPGVLANDRISLTVLRGEVHCLLGENDNKPVATTQRSSNLVVPLLRSEDVGRAIPNGNAMAAERLGNLVGQLPVRG